MACVVERNWLPESAFQFLNCFAERGPSLAAGFLSQGVFQKPSAWLWREARIHGCHATGFGDKQLVSAEGAMAGLLDFVPMLIAQQVGPQRLPRIAEPDALTRKADQVLQYDSVMSTKLVIAYAAGLEIVHRSHVPSDDSSAIDLACGPGHFTLCLARYLGYRQVVGIDLSEPMVEIANRNAADNQLTGAVSFRVGDITRLEQIETDSVDLSTFTDAAHHMPDLGTVVHVLQEMDRITKPAGLVMVMDLARLRTEKLTEKYVKTLGADYVQRGLADFFTDFRNSMFAAWTTRELRRAIPAVTDRIWCHLVPRGLPTIQVILGLPHGRSRPFVRRGYGAEEHPLLREWYPRWQQEVGEDWARETRSEWKLMRAVLSLGSRKLIHPRTTSPPTAQA